MSSAPLYCIKCQEIINDGTNKKHSDLVLLHLQGLQNEVDRGWLWSMVRQ